MKQNYHITIRKHLTLSLLDETIRDKMIVESKFKSILTAILLGLTSKPAKTDATTSSLDSKITSQTVNTTALASLDRAVNVGKKILSTTHPNQALINACLQKMQSDMDKMFDDVYNNRITNVNIEQYFPLLMSAYNLTEKDQEYLKIKSIVDALSREIKKIYDNREDVSHIEKIYLYKLYPLQFYIKLLSP